MVKPLRVYPRVPQEELTFYKRLADALGLLALYPPIALLSYALGSIVLMIAAEGYFLVTVVFAAYTLARVNGRRERFATVLLATGIILEAAPYLLPPFSLREFLGVTGKLIVLVTMGLYLHSLAVKLGMREMLDKYGGLAVLGSLALITRYPLFVLGGLLLVALGFGGASNEVRRLYLANKLG